MDGSSVLSLGGGCWATGGGGEVAGLQDPFSGHIKEPIQRRYPPVSTCTWFKTTPPATNLKIPDCLSMV